jgi:hypothetical protein
VTLAALALLAGCAWTLGAIAVRFVRIPDVLPLEQIALRLIAGLGFTSVVFGLLLLAGVFSYAFPLAIFLALLAIADVVREIRTTRLGGPEGPRDTSASRDWLLIAAFASLLIAALGNFAPTTDDDALAYVIPLAQRMADTGRFDTWPDLARGMWPQHQQVLLAFVTRVAGVEHLGWLTGFELLLCAGAVSALARRVCALPEHAGAAIVMALGAPVVAFLAVSAKEDVLLAGATAAAAVCLAGAGCRREHAAAGLFAGIAAGAKYSGLGVALAVVIWTGVASKRDRVMRVAVTAAFALLAGGVWYLINAARFGNPVAPFVWGAAGTRMDLIAIREFLDGYGVPRTALSFVLNPLHIFWNTDLFCGRANLFNPFVYAAPLLVRRTSHWRAHAPLWFIAAVLYVGWFFNVQNARLLWPAAMLLAPAAADVLVPIVRRSQWLMAPAALAVAASLALPISVGIVRDVRGWRDREAFLERSIPFYADIEWMNTHLDAARHRVASTHKVLAHLSIPHLYLDPTYQIEIGYSELEPPRLIEALRRQGITHLFGEPNSFDALAPAVRMIHVNPTSMLGGSRFFREPYREPSAVFEVVVR